MYARDRIPAVGAWAGRRSPARIAVPTGVFTGMPAGYSGSPQRRKLGLKEGQRVALDSPPPGWTLDEPPAGLVYVAASEPADVVVAFFRQAEELGRRLPGLVRQIYPSGGLWVAWPRRAAGHQSNLSETLVRARALELGVVDVKVAAIDEDWSGLRFVWRLANRDPRSGPPTL